MDLGMPNKDGFDASKEILQIQKNFDNENKGKYQKEVDHFYEN